MGRILSIDYGIKKCGLAVTDPLQIIVNPLKTIKTSSLLSFLNQYWTEEKVDKIVFGMPTHFDGNPTYLVEEIHRFADEIKTLKPELPIDFQNENFSSQQAREIILKSGLTKKQRQDKSRLDKISAVIILQRYLKHI
ncbi:MAG: Holliday junction resolvase RuvX [Saprospiraceae bacterium]|nr:Holliday junction resolvase RuvX [Bacteroidia bacterium]MBT8230064.1 Holliday junction resolvase RuvX [Bacteroidia bacterium]NNF20422.1 Holliday junction resolvase RuvX [Saprospiraceae bacterium]NNK90473.1 Holliday junction resolvase RuvX [Saprospiraceae bacterium]